MADTKNIVTFDAEIGPINSRKLVSQDREQKVTFVTQDQGVMVLAAVDPQMIVRVTVEVLS